jgi:hypothetical protein
MIVKIRDMRNLADIHSISATLATVAGAVLVVTQHTVSACSTGPPPLANVSGTLLPCYFLANVAREMVRCHGKRCSRRLSDDINIISLGKTWYIPS